MAGRFGGLYGGNIKRSGKKIDFFAIDNFTAVGSKPHLRAEAAKFGADFYQAFCDNVKKCRVAKYVRPLRGDSTAMAFQFFDESVDFVFIDACHEYRKVKSDLLAWTPKVKGNGVISGHDYDDSHGGVVKAVNEVFGKDAVKILGNSWIFQKQACKGVWWPNAQCIR